MNSEILSSIEVFDIIGNYCSSKTNDHHVIPDLDVARFGHGYVAKDKVVYLLGGYERSTGCKKENDSFSNRHCSFLTQLILMSDTSY